MSSHQPNRFRKRGDDMKKTNSGRGFWSWILGQGWGTAGGNG